MHEQWLHVPLASMAIFVERVETDDNIADLPSRLVCSGRFELFRPCFRLSSEEFDTLRALGTEEWAPYMDDAYEDNETWEVLRERWSL